MNKYGFTLIGQTGNRFVFERNGSVFSGFGNTEVEAMLDAADDVYDDVTKQPMFRAPEFIPQVNRCFTY